MSNTPSSSPLFAELSQFAGSIQAYLTDFYGRKLKLAQEADHVSVETMTVVQEFMLRRGKCVQSFIAWSAYKMAGGTNDVAMTRVGGAIEANHYFLLNIDDMADRDTLRHGGPTVEVMFRDLYPQIPQKQRSHYARSFSEIASALIYSHVFEMLLESGFPPEKITEVMKITINKILHAPAVGWQIHMLQNFEPLSEAKQERFIKGLTYVTAYYKFIGPSLIGLTLADADPTYIDAFTTFGENVGTAFQVHDDILGLFGDPAITGKSAGNDVREGKKTLLLQYAYAHADAKEKEFLARACGKTDLGDQEIAQVRYIVENTGSLAYSQKLAKEYAEKGKAALAKISNKKTKHYVDNLLALADFIVTRDK